MKIKSNELSIQITKINQRIIEYESRIREQNELKQEFVMSGRKIRRTSLARQIFRNTTFHMCPECGESLEKIPNDDKCSLCKQEIQAKIEIDARVKDIDLQTRIKELDDYIENLNSEFKKLDKYLTKKEREKDIIDSRINDESEKSDSEFLQFAISLEREKGIVEGRLNILGKLIKLPEAIGETNEKINHYDGIIGRTLQELKIEHERIRQENHNLKRLKELFKDTLLQVKFPDFTPENNILIDPFTFSPKIQKIVEKKGIREDLITDFYNLGSGGTKVIFKACYGLAIHRLTNEINGHLPPFLIIDTPMKNLNEEINKILCTAFYQFVYKLSKDELKNIQMILIDKMYFKPDKENSVIERELTYEPDKPKLF